MTIAMKAPEPAFWYVRDRQPGFPQFDPGLKPCGPYLLIQEYSKPSTTAGGLILLRETQSFDQATVSVGLVLAIGPGCFRFADGTPWAEGPWCEVGDYVKLPRLSDQKWVVGDPEYVRTAGEKGNGAIFRMVAHDVISGVFTDLSLIPTFNTVVA